MKNKGSFIVTGGCSGIGKSVLNAFTDRFIEKNTLNIDVNNPSNPIDIRNYDSVLKSIQDTVREGEENYLFSNAGVVFFLDSKGNKQVDFINAPIEQLHAMVDINFKGQINVLHAFINAVINKKARGNIIVISSISAFHSGGPNMAVYDSTKAAISALAKRLVPYNKYICINIIEPGSVRTNIGGWNTDFTTCKLGLNLVEDGQELDIKKLGGREVSLSQIVSLTEFLFFNEHGLNGAEIVADEGLTLMGREGY